MKNKQNKPEPKPESVCGCPFGCADWNSHDSLHGISQQRRHRVPPDKQILENEFHRS